LVAHLLII
jgi:hypothetical protein